jgi:hypothetical protein
MPECSSDGTCSRIWSRNRSIARQGDLELLERGTPYQDFQFNRELEDVGKCGGVTQPCAMEQFMAT